jgi:biotin carboxyl carrier protein
MRKFMINVNGSRYEVEVEELAAGQTVPVLAPIAPVAAPVAAPVIAAPVIAAPVVAAPVAPVSTGAGRTGSEPIKAPMPGTILSVAVVPGQEVKKNQILCVLEAMKMENEIVAARDGVVAGVHTSKGSSVNAGDLLISLE